MPPFVSVIIPCRDEAGSLARCLESVLASDYPPDSMEVIVADGASEDQSRQVAASLAAHDPRVCMIANPARITPAGLNRAIEAARGDYILRVDAHSTIGRDYVAGAIHYLEHSDAWSAGGVMRTLTEARGVTARAIRAVLSHPFGVGNSGFRTAKAAAGEARDADALFNACWRRDVFRRVGGFNERLRRSQDIEFSARIRRAGGRLALLGAIESRYYIPGTYPAFLRQSWTNGVWALLPAIHLGHVPVGLRHLAPLGLVGALAASVGGALTAPVWLWPGGVIAAAYAALNLAASAGLTMRERDPRLALLAPLVFATLHFAYGAGSLWGALRVAAAWLGRAVGPSPAGRRVSATEGN
jgi:hypothetical protein